MRLLPLAVCLLSLTARADAVLVDRIVAIVDLTPITKSAVEERARFLNSMSRTSAKPSELRQAALTELIEEALVKKETERLKLEVSDDDVQVALQQIASQNQLTLEQLATETRKQGLELDVYKQMLRRKLLDMKWVSSQMNHAGLSGASDANAFIDQERARLMAALKARSAIEVRL